MKGLFFKPQNAVCADFMSFYRNGVFFLYYLQDNRNREDYGEGVSWSLVTTRDFIHFQDYGVVLPHGGREEQDLYAYTGCVIEARGQYHLFYDGHNPHFRELGKPVQGVMHAISEDLIHWVKQPDELFLAPTDQYEPHDWRDACVFFHEETDEYWMLLAARHKEGMPKGRGVTVLCSSKDLKKWKVCHPFWDPHCYIAHECPDLFRIGDWWYLLFSEFSDEFVTRYRMSHSLEGPWLEPENDRLDGKGFYAAKSCTDGKHRYVFGWNPTRKGETDQGMWEWGGRLVVHEIFQRQDGTLGVKVPESFDQRFAAGTDLTMQEHMGMVSQTEGGLRIDADSSFACAYFGSMPDAGKLKLRFRYSLEKGGFGLLLHGSDDFENGYYLRIEPANHRIVLDQWPRNQETGILGRENAPFMKGLEQKIHLKQDEENVLTFYFDGSCGVAYVNDDAALCVRMYDLKDGKIGVFARNQQWLVTEATLSLAEE